MSKDKNKHLRASSSRARDQFAASSGQPTFVTFQTLQHSFLTPSSPAPDSPGSSGAPSPLPDNHSTVVNAGVPEAFRLPLGKLTKRDATTRQKGLAEVRDLVADATTDDLNDVLPHWIRLFPRMSRDTDRRVRDLAFRVLASVCERVGKRIAPHLKAILPDWLASTFDPSKDVARTASAAFTAAFPSAEKRDAARKFAASQCVDHIVTSVKGYAPKKKSTSTTTDRSSNGDERAFSTAVTLAGHLVSEHVVQLESAIRILEAPGFLALTAHESVPVRAGVWTTVALIVSTLPTIVENEAVLAALVSASVRRVDDFDAHVVERLLAVVQLLLTSEPAWSLALQQKLAHHLDLAVHGTFAPTVSVIAGALPSLVALANKHACDATLSLFQTPLLRSLQHRLVDSSNGATVSPPSALVEGFFHIAIAVARRDPSFAVSAVVSVITHIPFLRAFPAAPAAFLVDSARNNLAWLSTPALHDQVASALQTLASSAEPALIALLRAFPADAYNQTSLLNLIEPATTTAKQIVQSLTSQSTALVAWAVELLSCAPLDPQQPHTSQQECLDWLASAVGSDTSGNSSDRVTSALLELLIILATKATHREAIAARVASLITLETTNECALLERALCADGEVTSPRSIPALNDLVDRTRLAWSQGLVHDDMHTLLLSRLVDLSDAALLSCLQQQSPTESSLFIAATTLVPLLSLLQLLLNTEQAVLSHEVAFQLFRLWTRAPLTLDSRFAHLLSHATGSLCDTSESLALVERCARLVVKRLSDGDSVSETVSRRLGTIVGIFVARMEVHEGAETLGRILFQRDQWLRAASAIETTELLVHDDGEAISGVLCGKRLPVRDAAQAQVVDAHEMALAASSLAIKVHFVRALIAHDGLHLLPAWCKEYVLWVRALVSEQDQIEVAAASEHDDGTAQTKSFTQAHYECLLADSSVLDVAVERATVAGGVHLSVLDDVVRRQFEKKNGDYDGAQDDEHTSSLLFINGLCRLPLERAPFALCATQRVARILWQNDPVRVEALVERMENAADDHEAFATLVLLRAAVGSLQDTSSVGVLVERVAARLRSCTALRGTLATAATSLVFATEVSLWLSLCVREWHASLGRAAWALTLEWVDTWLSRTTSLTTIIGRVQTAHALELFALVRAHPPAEDNAAAAASLAATERTWGERLVRDFVTAATTTDFVQASSLTQVHLSRLAHCVSLAPPSQWSAIGVDSVASLRRVALLHSVPSQVLCTAGQLVQHLFVPTNLDTASQGDLEYVSVAGAGDSTIPRVVSDAFATVVSATEDHQAHVAASTSLGRLPCPDTALLVAWVQLLDETLAYVEAHSRVRDAVAGALRSRALHVPVLQAVYTSIMAEDTQNVEAHKRAVSLSTIQVFAQRARLESDLCVSSATESSDQLARFSLGVHVYVLFLQCFSSLARSWYHSLERARSERVEKFTSRAVTEALLRRELNRIREHAAQRAAVVEAEAAARRRQQELRQQQLQRQQQQQQREQTQASEQQQQRMIPTPAYVEPETASGADEHGLEIAEGLYIRANVAQREFTAVMVIEDLTAEVVLRLGTHYPLQTVTIDGGRRFGVTESQWRRWMLQIMSYLTMHNGTVLDAVLLWKHNADKRFDGIEECSICYSVIHQTNLDTPNVPCKTCKHKFHSVCLFKWFQTGVAATCPLCRNVF